MQYIRYNNTIICNIILNSFAICNKKGHKVESKRLESVNTLESLSRVNRSSFNYLIMEKTFSVFGKDISKVFHLVNDGFFDGALLLPIILPSKFYGVGGVCYNSCFHLVFLDENVYFENNVDTHLILIHELIHLKQSIAQVDDNDHSSKEWIQECQSVLNTLNIKVNLHDEDVYLLKSFPHSIINKYDGMMEYFENSVKSTGQLQKLPDNWNYKKLKIEKKQDTKTLVFSLDVANDSKELISKLGADYCGKIAKELLKNNEVKK